MITPCDMCEFRTTCPFNKTFEVRLKTCPLLLVAVASNKSPIIFDLPKLPALPVDLLALLERLCLGYERCLLN